MIGGGGEMHMRSIHGRAWVGVIALATAACGGGSAQFVSKAPSGSWYGEFSKTIEKGARAMGCTMERHESGNGRSFNVSCSKPEYRYVGIAEKQTGDSFLWTCSMSESACRAFVDELIAAAK
jgi:hypothetical protein